MTPGRDRPRWPCDRARLAVDLHLSEELRVPQRLEDRAFEMAFEIQVPNGPIVESNTQAVLAPDLNADDVVDVTHASGLTSASGPTARAWSAFRTVRHDARRSIRDRRSARSPRMHSNPSP